MGEVREDLRVRLANLYLAHVFAFIENRKVASVNGDVEPDENLMRALEWDAAVYEEQVRQFRESVVMQARNQRMDILYNQMEEVFQFFCNPSNKEWEKTQNWFNTYPNIPLVKIVPAIDDDIPF
jgi:predicted Ser/Thr protein kinase